ncbi:MAG: hypothetical protein ABIA91_02570 [Patescibacteria group bacterium]
MYNIFKLIFIFSLIAFLIFFGLELIKEGFVSNHFDLNILLIFIFIFGFILLITKLSQNKVEEE